jgi:hypothetical protein
MFMIQISFDRPVITTREGGDEDKSIQARSESESFVRRVYFVEYWKEVLKHAFESEQSKWNKKFSGKLA